MSNCVSLKLLHVIGWEVDEIWSYLILRKIIKIVATGCQILRLTRTKIIFGWGSAPDRAGRAYIPPQDLLAGIKGTYF